jgi:hypothetical protein
LLVILQNKKLLKYSSFFVEDKSKFSNLLSLSPYPTPTQH